MFIFISGDEEKDFNVCYAWYTLFKEEEAYFFSSQNHRTERKSIILQTSTSFSYPLELPFEVPQNFFYITKKRNSLTNDFSPLIDLLSKSKGKTIYLFISSHMYPDTSFQMNGILSFPHIFLKPSINPQKIVAFVNGCYSWSWHSLLQKFGNTVLFTSASASRPSYSLCSYEEKKSTWSDFGRASYIAFQLMGEVSPARLASLIKRIACRSSFNKERRTKPCYNSWPSENKLLPLFHNRERDKTRNWIKISFDSLSEEGKALKKELGKN